MVSKAFIWREHARRIKENDDYDVDDDDNDDICDGSVRDKKIKSKKACNG
jgi:hypothetical protein